MPAVTSGSKVLVTGASGFIATWVIKTLLERGFHVRGTVRSSSKGDYLKNLFKDHADRFEYVLVEDIQKDGAFDEAVKGVDAVAHTASPYHFHADDPDEIIGPAVRGTVGILESVLKQGPEIQRIVITSSMAAIIEPPQPGTVVTLDETKWNELSVREVESKGKEASAMHKYRASKTLAERAAWDFVKKNKSSIKWDVVALQPPLVWGPTLHEIPSASSINTSVADIHELITGQKPLDKSGMPVGNWVDVRDVADAHVEALMKEKAGGERFILASGPFTWQDVLDGIHAAPDEAFLKLPKGTPGAGKKANFPVWLDTTKARTILGVTFRGLGETAPESVRSLLEREKAAGW